MGRMECVVQPTDPRYRSEVGARGDAHRRPHPFPEGSSCVVSAASSEAEVGRRVGMIAEPIVIRGKTFVPEKGSHSPDGHACVMEMGAYLAGEEWSGHPKC